MQTNNTAALAGIALVNQDAQAQIEAKAKQLVLAIIGEQNGIKSSQACIEAHQKDILALAVDPFDVDSIVAGTLPNTQSSLTISKVITDMNKAKQDAVSAAAANIVNTINRYQSYIAASNKNIAEYRAKLAALSADVTTEAILG